MDKPSARGSKDQFVPESYILPPEERPGTSTCKAIPVVNLGSLDGQDRKKIVLEILKACEEFGFFQVINHGVMESTMKDMMYLATVESFQLLVEDRANLYSTEGDVRLYTSLDFENDNVHNWRKEVKLAYSVEMMKLSLKILELIAEGLGLNNGYFENELSQKAILSVDHYPTCPDPSPTSALPKHGDPDLLALLQGSVNGLQIFKNDEWISVESIPNAFMVNIGHQLQIVSNGRLKSVHHRVVTNSSEAITTVGIFIYHSSNAKVEPAKQLINESNPAIYKDVVCEEFVANTAVDDTGNAYKRLKRSD